MLKKPFNNTYLKISIVIIIFLTLIFIGLPLTSDALKEFYANNTTMSEKAAQDLIIAFNVLAASGIFMVSLFISHNIIDNE